MPLFWETTKHGFRLSDLIRGLRQDISELQTLFHGVRKNHFELAQNGSKDPNNRVLGPECLDIIVFGP